MPRTTDFLTKQRKQITARLDELRPLYEEYLTLEKAQQALDQVGSPVRRALGRNGRRTRGGRRGPGRPPARRGPGRPRGSGRRATTRRATSTRTTGRRTSGRRTAARGTSPTTRRRTSAAGRRSTTRRSTGRRRAGGTRADQAFAAIRSNPGITIPELATRLNVRPNYLYRVTQGLEREKRVRKRGRGFHPA
jgi:hypothetical protein